MFTAVRSSVAAHVKQDNGADQDPSYELSEGADAIVIGAPAAL